MRIHSLHIYPVKGARGIAMERADVLAQGLRHDRRFLVVNEASRFITQREHPRMALVETAIDEANDALSLCLRTSECEQNKTRSSGGAIRIEHISKRSLARSLASSDLSGGIRRRVQIWDDEVDAIDVGPEAAQFFSDHLGLRCSLVYMPLDSVRQVELPYAKEGDHVGFADAYPVLITSLASLADLNARLIKTGAAPVPMDRFRPNIVLDDVLEPYAEERTSRVQIIAGEHVGDEPKKVLQLRTPKRCSRCVVTTIDQQTAEASKEPLRTLAAYRTEANKVYFAMNAIPDLGVEDSFTIAKSDMVLFDATSSTSLSSSTT